MRKFMERIKFRIYASQVEWMGKIDDLPTYIVLLG